MQSGRLRHRVIIQIPARTKNAFDEWTESWQTWATVWASIEPLRGKRYFDAKQANSEVEGIIRIRYRDGILPTMRVMYGSRIFRIISIIHPKEQRQELNIFYKESLD